MSRADGRLAKWLASAGFCHEEWNQVVANKNCATNNRARVPHRLWEKEGATTKNRIVQEKLSSHNNMQNYSSN